MTGSHEITGLLSKWGEGDEEAFDRLMSLVYDDLSRLASRALRGERAGHTLTTNALVHESYLNLVVKTVGEWQNRAQFFALASKVMRRILIDHARRRRALKRGGGIVHLTAYPETHWQVATARSALGGALARREAFVEAESLLVVSLETLEAVRGDGDPYTAATLDRLARLDEAWGRPDSAAPYRAKLAGRTGAGG